MRILLVFLIAASWVPTDPKEAFDRTEVITLVNQLFAGIRPELPENAYMPRFLRETLSATLVEIHAERIQLVLVTRFLRDSKNNPRREVLMAADVDEAQRKVIYIFVPCLLSMVRDEYRTPTGYDQVSKDIFAIAVAHEAIHFEKIPLPDQKDVHLLEEEERAWEKTIVQIIRPLRASGRDVGPVFQMADRILRRCNNILPCFEFTRFLAPRTAAESR